MVKPLIYVVEHEGAAKIYPGVYLGPDQFRLYRDACRNGGASFDVKISANTIRLDLLPALCKALGASFTLKIAPEVQEAAESRAMAILGARDEAQDRISALKDAPYPFQVVGIAALAARVSFLLGDEMGLGKTPQALLAIPAGWGGLVVCPASLKGVWLKACRRWRPDLAPRILERFEVPVPGELLIINYERLPVPKKEADVKPPKASDTILADFDFKFLKPVVLIGDEIHYIKSSKSTRTVRFRYLGRAIRAAGGRTWGLTGTPMPNSPMDLLNILTALDLLKESFGNYLRFCDIMNGQKDYWGKWTFGKPKPGAIDALRRVMLRRRRVEVLPDLPVITYEEVEVDVTAAARRASELARAAMKAAGVDLAKVCAGEQTLGAAQECVFTARRLLAEAKIPALVEIIEGDIEAGEPVIVGSCHRAPIDALAAIPGCRVMTSDTTPAEREQLEADFQAGKFLVIAGTIQVIAVGFTLTRAAHVLSVDEMFTPDWADQFNSRACRIGQTRGVLARRMVAPDTVDADVAAINAAKRQLIGETVDKAAGASIEADPQALLNLGKDHV